MDTRIALGFRLVAAWLAATSGTTRAQEIPEPIRAAGETVLTRLHAEGAQIYECKADASGKLAWAFREPIASLFRDGRTVGRHSAGPRWELSDGGWVTGKVEGKAPGDGAADIAWLRLSVANRGGGGALAETTTVQRVDTRGGALEGSCETAGTLKSVAYAAEYVFLKK